MKNKKAADLGAIALSYPPRVRVKATVKLSAAFFHDESSITIGLGDESLIAPRFEAFCSSCKILTLSRNVLM